MPVQFTRVAFWLGVLGSVKLFTDTVGYPLFQDGQVDALANGIATLLAIIGVFLSHDQKPPD